MDEAPFIEDLDLDSVVTPGELAAFLRKVHLRADKPSLRALAAKTRHESTPLSRTVVSEMLNGTRLPRKAVMVTFLKTCGLSESSIEPWRRAWERVVASDLQTDTQVPKAGEPPNPATIRSFNPQLRPAAEDPTARRNRSPVAERRELGMLLRELRVESRLTVEQVAERLLCSPSKISRIENGQSATPRDIRDLCELYEVTDSEERDYLMYLAVQGRRQGWWHAFDLPYATYIGLEAEAASIDTFQCILIPGLLQTEAYARALYATSAPKLDDQVIEQSVEARLTRQRILTTENPPQFHAIVDEAALHRVTGSRAIMREQLDKLSRTAKLSNVTLQVIPYSAGAYPGADTCLTLLGFSGSLADIAYIEGLTGSLYLDKMGDLSVCRAVFQALGSMALNPVESVDLIKEIGKVFR